MVTRFTLRGLARAGGGGGGGGGGDAGGASSNSNNKSATDNNDDICDGSVKNFEMSPCQPTSSKSDRRTSRSNTSSASHQATFSTNNTGSIFTSNNTSNSPPSTSASSGQSSTNSSPKDADPKQSAPKKNRLISSKHLGEMLASASSLRFKTSSSVNSNRTPQPQQQLSQQTQQAACSSDSENNNNKAHKGGIRFSLSRTNKVPSLSKSNRKLESTISSSPTKTTFNAFCSSPSTSTASSSSFSSLPPSPTMTRLTATSAGKRLSWTNHHDKQQPNGQQKQDETRSPVPEVSCKTMVECPLCVLMVNESKMPDLVGCRHRVCLECMQRYITTEINHSRLNITCPICSESLHPAIIRQILQNEKLYLKYESFLLRRVLAADPDARWCPAPDCGYAVLATGCASCPKLTCAREGCDTSFCYHCKQEWHPNQTCTAASIQRSKRIVNIYNINNQLNEETVRTSNRKASKSSQQSASIRAEDIKECPVCASRIIKMNDGSCNHMTCSICETEFCWLCMKEITDFHYFSPSGCTFWGKKPWSRKKKLLWRLGMLVGAPVCIVLIAGIAVPAIVIGIPVWAARKLHTRLERKQFSKYRKNAIITSGVLLSFVISPIISVFALAIGIPILLGYVYGVVPLSLCRSSGGCLSAAPSLENLQQEFQAVRTANLQATDMISIDTALSHKLGDPSIGDTSLYLSNVSLETNSIGQGTNVERDDRASVSNAGLAGSIVSTTVDDDNSTKALAGSIMSKESGYTIQKGLDSATANL